MIPLFSFYLITLDFRVELFVSLHCFPLIVSELLSVFLSVNNSCSTSQVVALCLSSAEGTVDCWTRIDEYFDLFLFLNHIRI